MRTKALLGLAALAVSAATCVAQSNVYSLNIVGYVNVDVNPGLNLIANPLKPSNGNYNITNTIVLPDTADGASIYKWAGTAWANDIPQWVAGIGWIPDFNVNLGEAFFLQMPAGQTAKITFVGEVATGNLSNTLNPGLNAVANKAPVTQEWPGQTVGNDGDSIFVWNKAGQKWDDAYNFIAGAGWSNGGAFGGGPALAPGQGVFYQNTGAAITWTQPFNPQ